MTKIAIAIISLASLCTLEAEQWEGEYQPDLVPSQSVPKWVEDVPGGKTLSAEIVEADGKKVLQQTLSREQRGGWRTMVGDGVMTASPAYTLEMRARVSGETGYLAGMELRFPEIGWVCVRIAPSKLEIYTTAARKTVAVDGTVFHTYRVAAENSQAQLYIDEDPEPVAVVKGEMIDKGNFLGFGDYGNLDGEGRAEYEYVRWANEARPPVPTP